jgi:RHS repeat-associated protein
VDALAGESSQSFDADGNKESLLDPNDNKTQFDFDLSGRLVQETGASGDKVKYTYNANDLLESVVNGREQERQFEYDAIGRLTRWTDSDGSVSYIYDKNGNVLTVTDASGTISREYDKRGRVTKYTDTRSNTLKYAYDEIGNLVTLTYPDGKKVHYEYDAASQLVKVTDWANRITEYAYDKNGRLISTLRPNNGTQMTRVYNDAGQLKQQKDIVVATEEVISQFDFSYDAAGNIIKEKTGPDVDPDINLEMSYQAANRLATVDDKAVQFDADGNMTRGPLSGDLVDFGFDSRNRLIQAGDTVYNYDAENQRIGVNQIQYVVNSQPALSQVLVKEDNGQKTFYVYGLGLIGQESNGEYLSYHFDFRGSTVALTNETGQVVERFQYSPYGVLLSGDASITPFLFNGMYGVMSDSNGLYYMRARFYSSEIRRFVNQDVLLGDVDEGQTLNRYAFVTGRPVSFVDPFGLDGSLTCKPKNIADPSDLVCDGWFEHPIIKSFSIDAASLNESLRKPRGKFCLRPLDKFKNDDNMFMDILNPLLGLFDLAAQHEQYFFSNGDVGGNPAYSDETIDQYDSCYFFPYRDDYIRKVLPDTRLGTFHYFTNNCQDAASKMRDDYWRLLIKESLKDYLEEMILNEFLGK